jgi:hypothetical protein
VLNRQCRKPEIAAFALRQIGIVECLGTVGFRWARVNLLRLVAFRGRFQLILNYLNNRGKQESSMPPSVICFESCPPSVMARPSKSVRIGPSQDRP